MIEPLNKRNAVLLGLFALAVRCAVSLWGYSGAGKGPMFGDYEAQRHWMEVTVNLPTSEWYQNSSRNDLEYWGLDYPPLTAYHSWLCGMVATFVNPDWVELFRSRGYESYGHKLFMRYTVMVADILIFFPAVYLVFSSQKTAFLSDSEKMKAYSLTLLYPGLILIDHGHFQYNCVSLGLFLLAVMYISRRQDLAGSFLFCLALNYKQMELYHAVPFFCFLLGSCFYSTSENGFLRLLKIGVTVILTFALCWLPFLTSLESAQQVLHRLFPFARGVFEDKVASVWCVLSVFVKLKQTLPVNKILHLCLATTSICLLPSSLELLIRPTINKFKLALVNSSLVFFLFSYHVHEKSILIPAVAVCVLIPQHPFWCFWFLQISTFSMLPLCMKDGLLVPALVTMVLFAVVYTQIFSIFKIDSKKQDSPVWSEIFMYLIFCISMVGMVALIIAMTIVTPPDNLPDLFPVLIAGYSCAHFLLFTLYFHYAQFTVDKKFVPVSKNVPVQASKKTKHAVVQSKKGKKKKD